MDSLVSNIPDLLNKIYAVQSQLVRFERVLIAFSGGLDSAVLCALSCFALGRDKVLAVTADSASLSRKDLTEACNIARVMNVEHIVIQTSEIEKEEYCLNSSFRCYYCKNALFRSLAQIANERNMHTILHGATFDDLTDWRPGALAAAEFKVYAPLQEAGISKKEVRSIARMRGLPNMERHQNACLASRIPHGIRITEEKLKQIEAAEDFLKERGFEKIRVRHIGIHAKIEVGEKELIRFHDEILCSEIVAYFSYLGFESIGIDLAGYRRGGANIEGAERLLFPSAKSYDNTVFSGNINQLSAAAA